MLKKDQSESSIAYPCYILYCIFAFVDNGYVTKLSMNTTEDVTLVGNRGFQSRKNMHNVHQYWTTSVLFRLYSIDEGNFLRLLKFQFLQYGILIIIACEWPWPSLSLSL